jgi:hypothetical protein
MHFVSNQKSVPNGIALARNDTFAPPADEIPARVAQLCMRVLISVLFLAYFCYVQSQVPDEV